MNGILIINKHKGVTSRDIVNDICHIFNTKAVGHTGTLDPIASGVLVVTLGKYTKLGDILTSEYKEYKATMMLGVTSDTLDTESDVINTNKLIPSDEEIINVINSYVKTYEQEVPIYSSVKVNGKKLYEYARNNQKVELPKRYVTIEYIKDISIKNNIVEFTVKVSKGTYIRSLIRDIGSSLGCGAIMTDLVRTKQGKFNIDDSYTVDNIRNNNYKLLNVEDVLDLEIIDTSDVLYKMVSNGAKLENRYSKDIVLFKYNNQNIALYKKDDNNIYRMYIKL